MRTANDRLYFLNVYLHKDEAELNVFLLLSQDACTTDNDAWRYVLQFAFERFLIPFPKNSSCRQLLALLIQINTILKFGGLIYSCTRGGKGLLKRHRRSSFSQRWKKLTGRESVEQLIGPAKKTDVDLICFGITSPIKRYTTRLKRTIAIMLGIQEYATYLFSYDDENDIIETGLDEMYKKLLILSKDELNRFGHTLAEQHLRSPEPQLRKLNVKK